MEFIIISGLSGAGKSKAASIMEDLDFFCVDNLPAPLIPKFAELGMAGSGEYSRVVLVTDVRGGTNFDSLFQALDSLKAMQCSYRILFMDASDETIIKRYKESRRSHPLSEACDTLEEAISLERKMLAPLRNRAEYIIDTTNLSTAKLRGELRRLFARGGTAEGRMEVRVSSFGFKFGLPMEADLVFDVRFLPNPFYIPELGSHTGLDQDVKDFVLEHPVTKEFLVKCMDMLQFLLPHYITEGKHRLVIAIGCTGGAHRSVAIAEYISARLEELGYHTTVNHRDIALEQAHWETKSEYQKGEP